MIKAVWIKLFLLFLLLSMPGSGRLFSEEIIYYSEGFENNPDFRLELLGRTPEGLNNLSTCLPKIFTNSPSSDFACEGKKSLRLDFLCRAKGYTIGMVYLPKPIEVKDHMYFSVSVRVPERLRNLNDNLKFVVWGEYPEDKRPVLGKLYCKPPAGLREPSQDDPPVWKDANIDCAEFEELPGEVLFYYSKEIKQIMEEQAKKRQLDPKGMCIFAWSFMIAGATPGTHYDVYLDNVRLASDDPVPPVKFSMVNDALVRYQELKEEIGAFKAGKEGSELAQQTNVLEKEIDVLHERLGLCSTDKEDGQRFCSLVDRYEDFYWKLYLGWLCNQVTFAGGK